MLTGEYSQCELNWVGQQNYYKYIYLLREYGRIKVKAHAAYDHVVRISESKVVHVIGVMEPQSKPALFSLKVHSSKIALHDSIKRL